jgi:hypothetical protein
VWVEVRPRLDGAIALAAHVGKVEPPAVVVRPGDVRFHVKFALEPLGELGYVFDIDADTGEVSAAFTIGHQTFRWVLARFDPTIGAVAGRAGVEPPILSTGQPDVESALCTPTVLRLHVADEHRWLAGAGRLVKQQLFADHEPFVFNVVASVVDVNGVRRYADPSSDWFNVFFGYYQIDCAKQLWSRPFAYDQAAKSCSTPQIDEILRLGVADWNWFSNWLYGVPTNVLTPYSNITAGSVTSSVQPWTTTAGKTFHHVTLSGASTASSYEAADPGALKLANNTPIGGVWRDAFGHSVPNPNVTQSFGGTVVDARLDMAYWEDDTEYHTVMFGGTLQSNLVGTRTPDLLDCQVLATRKVIEDHYPTLGF